MCGASIVVCRRSSNRVTLQSRTFVDSSIGHPLTMASDRVPFTNQSINLMTKTDDIAWRYRRQKISSSFPIFSLFPSRLPRDCCCPVIRRDPRAGHSLERRWRVRIDGHVQKPHAPPHLFWCIGDMPLAQSSSGIHPCNLTDHHFDSIAFKSHTLNVHWIRRPKLTIVQPIQQGSQLDRKFGPGSSTVSGPDDHHINLLGRVWPRREPQLNPVRGVENRAYETMLIRPPAILTHKCLVYFHDCVTRL